MSDWDGMVVPRSFDYRYLRPPDRLDIFHATLLHESEEMLVLTHIVHPTHPVRLRNREVLLDGSSIVWFLFKDQPFDVGRFYLPDDTWTGFYVDITEPVHWDGADADSIDTVVDLFLDVWITPTGEYDVLDEDELDEAARLGHVTRQQVDAAREALQSVTSKLARGIFPPETVARWTVPLMS